MWQVPNGPDFCDYHTNMSSLLTSVVMKKALTAETDAAVREACTHPSINISTGVMQLVLEKAGLCLPDKHRHNKRGKPRQKHIEQILRNENDAFITNCIAAGYDVTDMRFMNGKAAEDEHYADFLEIVHQILNERNAVAAPERRHVGVGEIAPDGEAAPVRPTPVAPSMRALHALVVDRMYSTPAIVQRLDAGISKIPSISTFSTFMSPANPNHVVSRRYNGKAGIRFKIQSRTARKSHPDAHYQNVSFKYEREWIDYNARIGHKILFISADDKCKIPVGAPGAPQTANTRQRAVIAGAFFPYHLFAW